MSAISSSKTGLASPGLRAFARRVGASLAILLVIAFLTLFGLIVSERGKAGSPARPLDATAEALRRTLDYVVNHPAVYRWHRQDISALGLVFTLFGRSAALLLVALGIATLLGVPLGIIAALLRRLRAAPLVVLISVLGVSTPSFLLAMLFWVINARFYRWLGLSSAPLPPTGFGWDAHLVMPALVLVTRPLAQIVQVTYVALSDVLKEDYVRTAHAKGLARRVVINRHALRNILIPILTTLGASLRFSLASLPVVESFFNWPGVGLALLQAIEEGTAPLVTDLIVSLGLLFLLITLALDVIYQVVDPRLREDAQAKEQREEGVSWRERWDELIADCGLWIADLRLKWLPGLRRQRTIPSLRGAQASNEQRATSNQQRATSNEQRVTSNEQRVTSNEQRVTSLWVLRSILGNLPLLAGTLLVVGFLGLAVYGGQLASASPYETHGVMIIEEEIAAPPFPPSTAFPWGSDAVGRDIQALVLAGARQTLSLALLATLARMLVGAILGVLTGWWRNGWLDRLVNGVAAVWAAFPVTLFAMILILALGIQQGVNVFVVALCVVGWGEIAQFIRGQVISLKPQPYIEAARSVGARTDRLLVRHVLPHLWAPLLVLAVLEMGSVLMLLAELGFLNVFLGGGFKAEIGEVGQMIPLVYHFSDMPEWGALLANIRDWWRSYPWLAWYPGLAFFLAILAFNLWGEGLRRFLEDTRVNIGRLINRYSVIAVGVAVFGGGWLVRSMTPIEMNYGLAQQFNVQRAMKDIQTLASPQFGGRESGTPGAQLAADYIAAQMDEIGLLPAGEKGTYFYTMSAPRAHLVGVPGLEVLDNSTGEVAEALAYRQDFVEYAEYAPWQDKAAEKEGAIVGIVLGPDPGEDGSFNLGALDLRDNITLIRKADFDRLLARGLNLTSAHRYMVGLLIINDDPGTLLRKYLFPAYAQNVYYYSSLSMMYVTPQAADQLLATAGSSLAQLEAMAGELQPGQVVLTEPGARVRMTMPVPPDDADETYRHVIGFVPGAGALMGEEEKGDTFGKNAIEGLDSNVIIVSAYYDGLGTGPDGTFYASANDNASGVAAMLEIARVLKESPSQLRKTIVFVAWSGGERREGFSVANAMDAKKGFNLLTVEAVIELSGVGAGNGQAIALGQGTSFTLVQLFQDAASRTGASITTRGRGPHFGLVIPSGFGGRSALSAYVSWDDSDQVAHTAGDTFEAIEPDKLKLAGQTTLLVVSVLGQAEAQQNPRGPLMPVTNYIQEARMFDEEQALEHIRYLADDELEGRRTGTPGARAASDYVAARFAEYGLQPAMPDGSYFQIFNVPYTTVVTSPILSMTFPGTTTFTRTYTAHIDYWPRIIKYIGTGDAEGRLIWLNECKPGDFATDQDLSGKIGLCYQSSLTDYDKIVNLAPERQVGGVLLITDRRGRFPRSAYAGPYTATIPTFYVAEPVVRDLLTGTTYTLGSLEQHPVIRPLSTTVHMAMDVRKDEVEARNVLGLLPGSDPDHKDEIVIIGANYDHLGRDPDGTIYNGAYVNASGVATMLEIARMWQAQGFRPARSVLFAAWDDETQGWLGAEYYIQNPVYGLDRTVAKLNLEMVGRGKELQIVGRGIVADQLEASARVYSVTVEFVPVVNWGDAKAFFRAGVPSAMLIWEESPETGFIYHTPEDDVENIQPGHLRATGVLAAHALATWSGGGPTAPLPDAGPKPTLRDLILPTPTCSPPWPVGSMTCDHGRWAK